MLSLSNHTQQTATLEFLSFLKTLTPEEGAKNKAYLLCYDLTEQINKVINSKILREINDKTDKILTNIKELCTSSEQLDRCLIDYQAQWISTGKEINNMNREINKYPQTQYLDLGKLLDPPKGIFPK